MSYSSLKLQSRPAVAPDAASSGGWKNGRYRFATPEAEQAWQRAAYRQAVNADTWHLGDEVDDASRDAILAGIAGPTPPMYWGPDGKYRFANAHTIEDAATRSHRAGFFAGKTMDQMAGAKMPGEDEYLAAIFGKSQSSVAANDNIMRRADDCAQEHIECDQLCRRAKLSPDMRGIWGGSRDRCMRGCLSAACGGNPVG